MNCLFCKIINKELPANIVFENEDFIGFKDLKPQAPEHILIIPKQHIESMNHITPEHEILIGKMMVNASRIAETAGLSEDGFRVVLNTNKNGGQTVYHLHAHILGGRALTWPPG